MGSKALKVLVMAARAFPMLLLSAAGDCGNCAEEEGEKEKCEIVGVVFDTKLVLVQVVEHEVDKHVDVEGLLDDLLHLCLWVRQDSSGIGGAGMTSMVAWRPPRVLPEPSRAGAPENPLLMPCH